MEKEIKVLIKSLKRRFEECQEKIIELVKNELLGDLGLKSAATIYKELDTAKKESRDMFVSFNSHVNKIDNLYEAITSLTNQKIEENSIFVIAQHSILQDELTIEKMKRDIIDQRGLMEQDIILQQQESIRIDQMKKNTISKEEECIRLSFSMAAKKKSFDQNYNQKI
jgi:hypothetical protein